jgi:hypothetical protein
MIFGSRLKHWLLDKFSVLKKFAFQISDTWLIASEDSHCLGTVISTAGYSRIPES